MKLSGTESMEVRGEARASQKDAIEFIRKTRSLKYLANSAVSVKEGD